MRAGNLEPIDAVYTWVDGADRAWRERKRQRLEAMGAQAEQLDATASSTVRYLNRDELRYSLRSLERFAPFIRKVYLVTDCQIPDWLDVGHPDLELVFHDDLFPDPSHLPTFSSQAIECHLHRLPGLSERFLYFNDDVLLLQPCAPSDFFDDDGRCIVYLDRREVCRDPSNSRYAVGVNAAARNTSELLEPAFGYRIDGRIDHTPYALRRSVIEEIWRRFPDVLEEVSCQPFRHPATVTLTSCLAQHYGLCTGTSVAVTERHLRYIKVKKKHRPSVHLARKLAKILLKQSKRRRFLSINDSGDLDASWLTAASIALFFRAVYPKPSRFEQRPRRSALLRRPALLPIWSHPRRMARSSRR